MLQQFLMQITIRTSLVLVVCRFFCLSILREHLEITSLVFAESGFDESAGSELSHGTLHPCAGIDERSPVWLAFARDHVVHGV